MKKISIITMILVLAGGLWLLSAKFGGDSKSKVSFTEKQSSKRLSPSSTEDREIWLSARSGVAIEHFTPCLIDLLEGFATTTDEGVAEAFKLWLERDHLSVLDALEHLDGLFVQYGVSTPEDLVAQFLLDNYSGEEVMELLGGLNQTSDVVRAVLGESLEGWANKDYSQAIDFLKNRIHFKDYEATRHILTGQVRSGEAARIAADIESLPESDPRKLDFLESIYGNWVGVDPDGFAEFINTLEDTSAAEQSLASYVNIISEADPETALAWSETIKDPAYSYQARLSAAAQFALQQPEKYDEWLSQQEFPSDFERADFLEGIENAKSYTGASYQDSGKSDEEIIKAYKEQDREAILDAMRELWGDDANK